VDRALSGVTRCSGMATVTKVTRASFVAIIPDEASEGDHDNNCDCCELHAGSLKREGWNASRSCPFLLG
jgi:hypothetical protein